MVDATQDLSTPTVSTSVPATDSTITSVSLPSASETSPVIAVESVGEAPTPSLSESVLGDPKPSEVTATETGSESAPIEKKDSVKTESAKLTDVKADAVTETNIELPKYDDFKLPEGVQLDKEPLDSFTKILGEIETGKLDHLGMQEKGQALIDLAAKSTTDSINRLNDYYVQFHENQKKQWFDAFKADPDMGGDKLDQTVGMLRDAVEQNAGSESQLSELRSLMKDTGVGNHPALTRLIYNMQQKINKFTNEGTENRMVPGGRPAPSKVRDYQRFYQGS